MLSCAYLVYTEMFKLHQGVRVSDCQQDIGAEVATLLLNPANGLSNGRVSLAVLPTGLMIATNIHE